MNTNKVSMTIRVDPKLHAYIKQQAPDNKSRFLEELVRKHAADNIQDDTFARIAQAIANDPDFISAVSSKLDKQKPADTTLQIDPRNPSRAWDPSTEEWVHL